MASENVSFDAEGYQMTPDDKMREQLEAEIVGDTTIEVEAETQETEKEQPKAEENHEGTNNSKEETIMENQYEQQNAVPQEEKGFMSNTIDYVTENPVTAVAGLVLVAGATLLISKKLSSKPETITEIGSSMASAVATKGSKAAKYALMMRH